MFSVLCAVALLRCSVAELLRFRFEIIVSLLAARRLWHTTGCVWVFVCVCVCGCRCGCVCVWVCWRVGKRLDVCVCVRWCGCAGMQCCDVARPCLCVCVNVDASTCPIICWCRAATEGGGRVGGRQLYTASACKRLLYTCTLGCVDELRWEEGSYIHQVPFWIRAANCSQPTWQWSQIRAACRLRANLHPNDSYLDSAKWLKRRNRTCSISSCTDRFTHNAATS